MAHLESNRPVASHRGTAARIFRKRPFRQLLSFSIAVLLCAVNLSNAFSAPGTAHSRPWRNTSTVRYRTAVQSSRDLNPSPNKETVPSNDDGATTSNRHPSPLPDPSDETSNDPIGLQRLVAAIKDYDEAFKQRPPPEIEDTSVLLYDIFLLINLTASVSFWVVHRMDMAFIAPAISEGCLLSILWVASGLYSGAFLYSAVDGHRPDGGPQYASMLALNTFVNTMNLRLLFALGAAVLDHRSVGAGIGEDLIGLELGFGLVLMTVWRALHSKFVLRM